jgi:16S rRNA C967 or C1407 C5-methylase (RsmB/RsmF family)
MDEFQKVIPFTDMELPRYSRLIHPKYRTKEVYERKVIAGDDSDGNQQIMIPVSWFPSFFAIPGDVQLSKLRDYYGIDYKKLGLYPMDISSALTVKALGTVDNTTSLKILDLCVAPGGKYQMISEKLSSDSLIVGVDISENRLNVCRSLLEDWNSFEEPISYTLHESSQSPISSVSSETEKDGKVSDKIRTLIPKQLLFHCDGTQFGFHPGGGSCELGKLLFDSTIYHEQDLLPSSGYNRKRKNKSYRYRLSKALKEKQQSIIDTQLTSDSAEEKLFSYRMSDFDYVLVDAECTHDASYRHLKYFKGPEQPRTVGPDGIDAAEDEKALIFAGKQKWNKKKKDNQQNRLNIKRPKFPSDNSKGYFRVETENFQNFGQDCDDKDFWEKEHTSEDIRKRTSKPEISRQHEMKSFSDEKVLAHEASVSNIDSNPGIAASEKEEENRIMTLSHNIDNVNAVSEGKLALQQLQRSLLQNGFTLLKKNGILVYSTCSQDYEQNEGIVEWFLANNAGMAVLESVVEALNENDCCEKRHEKTFFEVDESVYRSDQQQLQKTFDLSSHCNKKTVDVFKGSIPGTIRINYRSGMSGHFIARIRKI